MGYQYPRQSVSKAFLAGSDSVCAAMSTTLQCVVAKTLGAPSVRSGSDIVKVLLILSPTAFKCEIIPKYSPPVNLKASGESLGDNAGPVFK